MFFNIKDEDEREETKQTLDKISKGHRVLAAKTEQPAPTHSRRANRES